MQAVRGNADPVRPGVANQNLQRSNDNRQPFAYVASHDLQEPLQKVQAFSSLLKQSYGQALGDSELQLFLKLLSNALKFTPDDRQLQIRSDFSWCDRSGLPGDVQPTSSAQQFYQISVSDQGVGFDPRYR